ncbi:MULTISPECIES: YihY/virulence factor BrkB family protein [Bradyrhizobium]|jgi:membrane protein|uniref:Ribonuclease BN n=1 Tax=Bradyrhizobium japonicum TaxID=375 RepID=A0A1Y2JFJ5_BRAJP|nr:MULTISPECIES: YihY/virulence factor BrkB family protein [Bradyrhizobium]MCK1278941.1 YihY/virulence factor BrkB family protein [Bradyrhizobium sp. 61]MCK1448456.1 YihY/virulence factor BrkB family protein [Bradyrhizobium sp. 48]MCK1464011.1 YihY/virulence factor BrkB family protein [Bradyrhizobium sp. 2]OSJ27526.1 ribonuclease BN [Bradyrhizobium japonicum]TFW60760.1 YihY/virulence factor BrkB family protein [Bradyrhizobium sp. MOS001]
MRARRTEHLDSWLLVAATAVFVLSAERYFQESGPIRPGPPQDHRNNEANSPETSPAGAAMQLGHGRHAKSPFAIPWAGWKDIFWRTYQRIDDDRLLATAGGVVFFGLLAVFPAVTALVSSYGLFADPSTISSNLHSLAMLLPEGAFQIVEDQVTRVVSNGNTALGVTFLFGLLLAIWSANAGVKAIFDALNVAYEEREKRSFVRLNTVSLAFTVGGIAALLLMVGTVVAFPLALNHLGIAPESRLIVALARWPVLFVILLAALAVLYRFAPSRDAPRWQWLSLGAVTAAILWIAGSALLSWYLSEFANYNATYGSLGAAIGLMMWMWMSAIVIMFGAELNSEIERQTLRDTTTGPPKPLGTRQAVSADTVGAAAPS